MKSLDYKLLKDGTYSVKIYGRRGTVSSEVIIPETNNGVPVTEVKFGRKLDANFSALHIPASVTHFVSENKLSAIFAASITVDENNPSFRSDGKALYSKDGTVLYRLFPRYIEEYSVMPGTKFIFGEAFAEHTNLKRVVLPDGLVEIKEECFGGCSEMAELNIPDSVEYIGASAFRNMSALRTLKLPANLRELESDLLNKVNLTELYIPASVEKISENMIYFNLETFIGKYIVSAENPFFRSENGVIYSKDMTVLVIAPSVLPSVFEVPGGVVRIAEKAFSNSRKLTEVIFPESLKYIGDWAFFGCLVMDVTIPKNVVEIGSRAISPQRNLTIYDTVKAKPDFISASFHLDTPLERFIIIRDARTGEIKDKIWSNIPVRARGLIDIYRDCFDENWNFDHDRFDEHFTELRIPFIIVCYIVFRLNGQCSPHEPSPRAREEFAEYMRKYGANIMKNRIDRGDVEYFVIFADHALTEQNITEVADYAAKKNAVEFTAFLLDYRNKHFGDLPDGFDLQ